MRLRTKFLLSLILISSALTFATLMIVQQRLRDRSRTEIGEALRNSVVTFNNFQKQRQETLERSAGLLADLPNLRALMTTQDATTIQDGTLGLWQLAGSDLLALSDRAGRLVALHTAAPGLGRDAAQGLLRRSLRTGESRDWWFGSGHLYEVFLQPIYFGSPSQGVMLGVLAMGYEIGADVAQEVSEIASSQVAFSYGTAIAVSTLTPAQQARLQHQINDLSAVPAPGTLDLDLDGERFTATSVELPPGASLGANPGTNPGPGVSPAVTLTVLKSYNPTIAFLKNLNRWLLGVGLAAVLAGSLLVFLISDRFTRPLADLVSGVRALEKGDFAHPLPPRTGDEAGELTEAFGRMRESLEETGRELLRAERLATVGRMASAITHDLRHPLTSVLAYAEFLSEGNLPESQRKDLYEEIRLAVNRMADLTGSLLEFSRDRQSLHLVFCDVEECVESVVRTVRSRPEFRQIAITVWHEGHCQGWFDRRRLERVFHNLLLNACEAVSPEHGAIEIRTRQTPGGVEIRIEDNGPGIPESIRETVFQPFVSSGKENGTGLGLAVVERMVQDHGGTISIEQTGASGTVFRVNLPSTGAAGTVPASKPAAHS